MTISSATTIAAFNREETPTYSRLRWAMVAFAFAATLINYLDRQVLSVVVTVPEFKHSVPMGEASYGYVSAAFMLAYAVMNGLSGPFVDFVGTRIGYACCMLWWSLAGALHVFARGPWSLGLLRFMLGAGEAGNWPAAAKLVGEWFPARERALASGIFNSGASIGSVISTPLIAGLVLACGWRSAFLVTGALGLLWVIAWWWIYRPPPDVQQTLTRQTVPLRSLLTSRFVIAFTVSKVFMDPVWYFFVFWFPRFLSEVHHLNLEQIGLQGWVPYLTAAIGNLAGGLLTGVLIRCGASIPLARKASTACFALLMLATIPAIFTDNPRYAIALVSLTTFGYTGYTANTLAFPADVYPRRLVASVWGLASMGSGFGGMLFMMLSGQLIAHFGYRPVFIGYGILPLIAMFLILFALGPLRPNPRFSALATG